MQCQLIQLQFEDCNLLCLPVEIFRYQLCRIFIQFSWVILDSLRAHLCSSCNTGIKTWAQDLISRKILLTSSRINQMTTGLFCQLRTCSDFKQMALPLATCLPRLVIRKFIRLLCITWKGKFLFSLLYDYLFISFLLEFCVTNRINAQKLSWQLARVGLLFSLKCV